MRYQRNHVVALILTAIMLITSAFAQRTTGSIQGRVTDPQGAVVSNAKVTITNNQTNFKVELTSNAEGMFEAANLPPADYEVTAEAPGFSVGKIAVPVRVGVTAPGNVRLSVQAETSDVSVTADAVTVDTQRHTVQGLITAKDIEALPLNTRNFLSLAQLEPGAQIVDGGDFDPTKNGLFGISLNGRTGRVTRIQVDGADITDLTVGSTVMNVSNESVQEFGIQQSNYDPSTELTSSGAVNVITGSGTNTLHGSGVLFYRNESTGADQRLVKDTPEKPEYQRRNWAAKLGGPAIKDRMFWHAEYENVWNPGSVAVTPIGPFQSLSRAYTAAFNERSGGGRLDFNVTNNLRTFYRFLHNDNLGVAGLGSVSLSAFANRNNSNMHVLGADLGLNRWTHSFRFSYLNFNNFIQNANDVAGTPVTGVPGLSAPVTVNVRGQYQAGPNSLAPQQTFQDNFQGKYDTSFYFGKHTLRAGLSYNKVTELGYASFYGDGPRIRSAATPVLAAGGNASDPLDYIFNSAQIANGLGYFSEKGCMGRQFGCYFLDLLGVYAADSWRVSPNFTFNAGLRWSYNGGMNNADLARDPGVSAFDPTLGGKPRKDTNNFAPQVGFAWNVGGNGKTVVRGGAGVFYEVTLLNALQADRTDNLVAGFGNNVATVDPNSPTLNDPRNNAVLFDFNSSCVTAGNPSGACGNLTLREAAPFIVAAQNAYRAATQAASANYPDPTLNPLFSTNRGSSGMFDPNWRTPYSMQFNIGIQHEIRSGLVISADYLRNRGIGFLQGQDMNFVGAARFLDANIANAAVADMLAFCGATDIVSAAAVGGCANASTVTGRQGQNFADITLLADFGAGGGPAPNTGMAFGGRNRAFNNVPVYRNSGTSTFDALQLRINGRLGTFGFLKNLSTNSSYQFGELRSNGGRGNFGDQDLFNLAMNNDRPTDYFGPSNQSSRHQISVGFGMEMPMGFNFSTITTYRSPLPTSLLAPDWSSGGFENIFTSDLDGDGLINDPIPGQGRGSYGRAVSAHDLAKLMNNFNSSQVGKLTPAGQALVAAGVLSADELKALGGYIGYHGRVTCTTGPQCAANLGKLNPVGLFVPTASPFSNPHFFNSDIRISNKIRVGERYVIEPMVEIFNVLNKQNYVSFGDTSALATQGTINGRTGILGSPTFGAVNTVAAGDQVDERGVDRVGGGKIGLPGTPRAFQFGVRVSF